MRIHLIIAGAALLLTAPFAAPTPAVAAADGCASGLEADFNGDNRSDTVVADPAATVNGQAGAGRLIVLYGDADGLVGEGPRDVLWQGEAEVAGVAEAGDGFGSALALGDLDCDSYTDVVVGTPGEDFGATTDAGYVQVLYGGAGGLAISDASTNYTAANFGRPVTAGDQFGFAVDLVEDLGQGGTPAPDAFGLAIGVPGADVGGDDNAGAVAIRAAYDGGSENYWITQDSGGIPGGAEPGDRFGAAVACFISPTPDEMLNCVIGAPNEDAGSRANAGTAVLVRDIYFEDELVGVSLDQDAAGVPDSAQAGDQYGRSVDVVRVGGTVRIAVGAPGEDVGGDNNAGLVQLFRLDADGVDPGTALTQDTAGVGDSSQAGDIFGDEVAWIAPGLGDPRTRLAVGVPGENTGAGADAGLVQVFPTHNLGAETTWSQGSPGVPGAADGGDRFGEAIGVVAGTTERVLLVGVPEDTDNTGGMVDVIPFGGGAPRAWVPGGAIPGDGAVRFGGTIGSVNGGSE